MAAFIQFWFSFVNAQNEYANLNDICITGKYTTHPAGNTKVEHF